MNSETKKKRRSSGRSSCSNKKKRRRLLLQRRRQTTDDDNNINKETTTTSSRTTTRIKSSSSAAAGGETRKRQQRETNDNDGQCVNVSDRYEKIGRLGEGTYGIVYKAREKKGTTNNNNNNNNKIVALKRCIPHHQASDGFPTTALREINALRICRGQHPNIVQLEEVAVSSTNNGVYMVMSTLIERPIFH